MDKLICAKLSTGEEVVGILLKEYSEGDLKMGDVMSLVVEPEDSRVFLEPYLIGGNNKILDFRAANIITFTDATNIVVDLFTRTVSYISKAEASDEAAPKPSVN